MKLHKFVATALITTCGLIAAPVGSAHAQNYFTSIGLEFGTPIHIGVSITGGTERAAFTLGMGEGKTREGYRMSDYVLVSGSVFAASFGDLYIYPSASVGLYADCDEVGILDGECVRMQYFNGEHHGGRIDKRLDVAFGADLFLLGNRNGLSFSPKIYASGGFSMAFGFMWSRFPRS